MKLTILGSSSTGNSYIIQNDTAALLIEAGCSIAKVKKALDFNITKVAGCIITHSHGDHSRYISKYLSEGINCWASKATLAELSLLVHIKTPFVFEDKETFFVGDFKVKSFKVKHDVECYGFLIYHPECGKVLFLTDTFYSPFLFSGLNQVLIEANYCEHILEERHLSGKIHPKVRDRVVRSHMSLQTLKKTLLANNLSQVNNVVLIHLSDSNSNAADFKKQIEELTGKKVTIADKDVTIDFDINPF